MKLTASLLGIEETPVKTAADLTKVAHLLEAGRVISDAEGNMFRVRAKFAGPEGTIFKLADLQGKPVSTPADFYPVNRYAAKVAKWMRFVLAYNADWDMYVKEYIRAAGLPVDETYNWAKWFQAKFYPKLKGDDEVKDEAIHQTIITALAQRKALDPNNPAGFQHAIKRFPPGVQQLPLDKQVTQFLLTLFSGRVQEANQFIDKMQRPDSESIEGPSEYELGLSPGGDETSNRSVLDTEEHATQPEGQETADFKNDMNKFRTGFSAWLQETQRPETAKNYLNLWDAMMYFVLKSHEEPKISDIYPFWARLTVDEKHPKGLGFDSLKQYWGKFTQLVGQYAREHAEELQGNPLVEFVQRLPKAQPAKASKASLLGGLKVADAWMSGGPNGDGEIVQAKCPLCGHVPVYKEDPAAGAPKPYYCHACNRGFDNPSQIETVASVDAAGAEYVGDNDPSVMASKKANEVQPDVAEAKAQVESPDSVDADIKQPTVSVPEAAKVAKTASILEDAFAYFIEGQTDNDLSDVFNEKYTRTGKGESKYINTSKLMLDYETAFRRGEDGRLTDVDNLADEVTEQLNAIVGDDPNYSSADTPDPADKAYHEDMVGKGLHEGTAPISEADDLCNACGTNVANRECAHGILCDTCDEQVHGLVGGVCELEERTAYPSKKKFSESEECPECEHPLPHDSRYGCESELGDVPGGELGPAYAKGPCGCRHGLDKQGSVRLAGIGHEFTNGIRPQTNVQDTGRLEGDAGPDSPSERSANWRMTGAHQLSLGTVFTVNSPGHPLHGQKVSVQGLLGHDQYQVQPVGDMNPRAVPTNLSYDELEPIGKEGAGAAAAPSNPGVGGAAGLTPNQNPNAGVPSEKPPAPPGEEDRGVGQTVLPNSGSGMDEENQPMKKTVPPDLPFQRLHLQSLKDAALKIAGANRDIIAKLDGAAIADSIGWSGKFQEYIVKRGYFYTHGMTEDKLAAAVKNLIPEAVITSARNFWHPWPKDSWFEVRFKVPTKVENATPVAPVTTEPSQQEAVMAEPKAQGATAGKRAAVIERIKARKASKNDAKWAKLRRVADENGPEAAEALEQLGAAFGELADRVDAFRENLDLVDAPKSASLKTRIAARRALGARFKHYAQENPDVLANAVNELFHSLDDVAAGVEAFADNMGIELTMTPVEEAFVDEGQAEVEGDIPAVEQEAPVVNEEKEEEGAEELQVEANSGRGSTGWTTDRDENGQPKMPQKVDRMSQVSQGAAPAK